MADDSPQDTTTTLDTPADQTVVQPETSKAEEQPTETPPVETPKEETLAPVEEPKTEPAPETPTPEVPQTPLPDEASAKSGEPPKAEEQKPTEETKPAETKTEEPKPDEKPKEEVKLEKPIKEETPKPLSPDEALAKSGPNLDELRARANKERQDRKAEHLSEVEKLGKSKAISNDDVRELFHVSQSTATNYLEELTKQGKLKKSGKAKGTTYSS